MSNYRLYEERKYEFGSHILELRTRTGLTQMAFANQAGVHRRSVQNWETGVSYPKPAMLRHLIKVFLQLYAFSAGREYQEAHALWHQASIDGPYQLPLFDEIWFAHISALYTTNPFRPFQHEQAAVQLLDRIICAVSDEYVVLPSHLHHKITQLVQVFGKSTQPHAFRSAQE